MANTEDAPDASPAAGDPAANSEPSATKEAPAQNLPTTVNDPTNRNRASIVLIWQLLVGLAIVAAAAIAWRKLPNPSPDGRTPAVSESPVGPDIHPGSAAGQLDEAQRELAVAAINTYLRKNPSQTAAEIGVDKLVTDVIQPLVHAGLMPLTTGREIAQRIVEKGGWAEGIAHYGGDLLKDYLHHVWADECKPAKDDKLDPPVRYPPVTMTCSPTISLAPPAARYVYRSSTNTTNSTTTTTRRQPARRPLCPVSAPPDKALCPPPAPQR